ncbi:MbtH family protein [Streptomyces sp. M19]
MLNPFDDPDGRFLVLANAAGDRSLWPVAVEVPAGWDVVFGEDGRAACLAHVDHN